MKKITTKTQLHERLVEIDKELQEASAKALQDLAFVKWIKASEIQKDEVHHKSWWYPQVILVDNIREITITTHVDYLSYGYYEHEPYTLAALTHKLSFSDNDLAALFFSLYYASLGGRNYATVFDIMHYRLEKELE